MECIEWFMTSLGILCVLLIAALIFDGCYRSPLAADRANEHCRSLGFDQYKDFTRVGLFSATPVAIQCEYAEKYTDLGVRTATGG
jgi:hypothetical protein